ncbi:hypothetical protein Gogos_019575, partial [Gossypium gossypioides]|nr:hypothetical protein [Gossypium gossypioides]
GILDDLTLLQERGVDRILIQTDSLKVVHTIQRKTVANLILALVRRILQLLQNTEHLVNTEHWVVRHIPREANHVADRIAKMVATDMEEVNVLAAAPIELIETLDSDKASVSFVLVKIDNIMFVN